jgi:hypothetical protein
VQEQLRLPGFEPREVNELVEARVQLKAGGLNLRAEAALRLGEVFLVEEDFGEAEDRGQRRPQLVRHAREEERAVAADSQQLAVGVFERGGALPQLSDEALDAVALLVHRLAAAGVADGDDDGRADAADAAERVAQARGVGRDHHDRARQSPVRENGYGDARLQTGLREGLAQLRAAGAAVGLVGPEVALAARALDLRHQKLADAPGLRLVNVRVEVARALAQPPVVAAQVGGDAAQVPVAQEDVGEGLADFALGLPVARRVSLLVEDADQLGAECVLLSLRGVARRGGRGRCRRRHRKLHARSEVLGPAQFTSLARPFTHNARRPGPLSGRAVAESKDDACQLCDFFDGI